MATKKRSKPHKCVNHPGRVARGRCVKCRKWICRECASLRKGRFFCKDTCAPKRTYAQQASKKTIKEKPKETKAKPSIKYPIIIIVLLAGLTIGLGGIAFGLIQYRKNFELEERIRAFRKSRTKMIKFIKKRNSQIRELRKKIAVKEKKPDTTRTIQKKVKARILPQQPYNYSSSKLPVSFDNGATDKKLIAITFDGASHVNAANDILDTLMSRGVSSTVFLTGRFIRKYPELVQRIVAEGHEVGNHTSTHPHLTSWGTTRSQTTLPEITRDVIGRELANANGHFRKLTGHDMQPLWRAPYGEKNKHICLWGQQYGYLHIGWKQARTWRNNFDTNDWVPDPETPGYHTPQEILEKFNELAEAQPYGMNGAIILMHLGTTRKEKDKLVHFALGEILDQLREKDYEFVTVSVLLKESKVDLSLLEKR